MSPRSGLSEYKLNQQGALTMSKKINYWKVGSAYKKVDPMHIIGNKKPEESAKLKKSADDFLRNAGYKPNGDKL